MTLRNPYRPALGTGNLYDNLRGSAAPELAEGSFGAGVRSVRVYFTKAEAERGTNKLAELEGLYVWCARASSTSARFRLQFNEQDPTGGIPMAEGVAISGVPFSRLFVRMEESATAGWGSSAIQWADLVTSPYPIEVSASIQTTANIHRTVNSRTTTTQTAGVSTAKVSLRPYTESVMIYAVTDIAIALTNEDATDPAPSTVYTTLRAEDWLFLDKLPESVRVASTDGTSQTVMVMQLFRREIE